jgi:sulfatase modifying factor 1
MRKTILGLFIIAFLTLTTGCKMFNGFFGGGGKDQRAYNEGQLMGVQDREGFFQELPYGMVAVEGGTFYMGQADEDVAASQINYNRQVTVSSFYMDAEEITNNEYRQFLTEVAKMIGNYTEEGGSKIYDYQLAPIENTDNSLKTKLKTEFVKWIPNPNVWKEEFAYHYSSRMQEYYFEHQAFDNYPVVGITWEAADKFTEWRTYWLNQNEHLNSGSSGAFFGLIGGSQVDTPDNPTDDPFYSHADIMSRYPRFRLPTEAEWEYAARGGKEIVKYPWGGPYTRNRDGCFLANFKPGRGAYADDGYAYTAPVNTFLPNNFGLYNMAGNVAEWCQDDFSPIYNPLVWDLNPLFLYDKEKDANSPHLAKKVVRGGAWNDVSYYIQTGTRTYEYRDVASASIGFRCAMDYLGRLGN